MPLGLYLAALGPLLLSVSASSVAPSSLPIPKWPLGDAVANANIMWP